MLKNNLTKKKEQRKKRKGKGKRGNFDKLPQDSQVIQIPNITRIKKKKKRSASNHTGSFITYYPLTELTCHIRAQPPPASSLPPSLIKIISSFIQTTHPPTSSPPPFSLLSPPRVQVTPTPYKSTVYPLSPRGRETPQQSQPECDEEKGEGMGGANQKGRI